MSREVWSAFGRTTMHLAPRLSRPLNDPSPREVLGAGHPLVGTLEQLEVLRTRGMVVAILLSSSAAALLDGVSGTPGFVVAAALVGIVLACRAAILVCRARGRAVDVIIEGRADIPIAAVKRQRARLRQPRCRERLAAALDDVSRDAAHAVASSARLRPIFNVRVVTSAEPELTTVARLLRDDGARLSGIAMAERLILDGSSPLYRDDLDLLRQELRRIAYRLMDRS